MLQFYIANKSGQQNLWAGNTCRLPWRLVLAFSIANELLHLALLPIGLSLPLLICPAEVYKTSVPHYFKVRTVQN